LRARARRRRSGSFMGGDFARVLEKKSQVSQELALGGARSPTAGVGGGGGACFLAKPLMHKGKCVRALCRSVRPIASLSYSHNRSYGKSPSLVANSRGFALSGFTWHSTLSGMGSGEGSLGSPARSCACSEVERVRYIAIAKRITCRKSDDERQHRGCDHCCGVHVLCLYGMRVVFCPAKFAKPWPDL
jgi:hypothetical protein